MTTGRINQITTLDTQEECKEVIVIARNETVSGGVVVESVLLLSATSHIHIALFKFSWCDFR